MTDASRTEAVDSEGLWAARREGDLSEFDILTTRGVIFRRKPDPTWVLFLGIAVCVFLVAVSLTQFAREVIAGRGAPYEVLWPVVVFSPCVYWIARYWARRNDRLVVDDRGIVMMRGDTRLSFAWAQINDVAVLPLGFVRVRSRDGRSIWVANAFNSFDFLRSFLHWLPTMSDGIARNGGSLRRAVDEALNNRTLRFRFERYDVLRMADLALRLATFGGAAVVLGGVGESTALVALVGGGFLLGGSVAFLQRAVRAHARRHDVIFIDRNGVGMDSPAKSVCVSWADVTRIDVLTMWAWGDGLSVPGPNGEIVFDDEPGMRHREVAQALLQHMLFGEMRRRGTWEHLRALDQLKL
jgi:hypothetical protein